MLSGASCGWSCRMIGDDSSRSDRSGGPASTGQVCSDVHPSTNGCAHRGGSVIETHAPALGGEHGVRGDQRRAQHLLARRPGGHDAVVDRRRAAAGARGRGRAGRRSTRPPARAAAQHSRRKGPSSSTDAGSSTGIVLRQVVERHRRRRPAAARPPRTGSTAGRRRAGCGPAAAGTAAGSAARQPGLGSSSTSVRLRVGSGAVGRRGEHAELPAQPVLLRRRPVGVQEVPLEQHGVGDRADLIQGAHR